MTPLSCACAQGMLLVVGVSRKKRRLAQLEYGALMEQPVLPSAVQQAAREDQQQQQLLAWRAAHGVAAAHPPQAGAGGATAAHAPNGLPPDHASSTYFNPAYRGHAPPSEPEAAAVSMGGPRVAQPQRGSLLAGEGLVSKGGRPIPARRSASEDSQSSSSDGSSSEAGQRNGVVDRRAGGGRGGGAAGKGAPAPRRRGVAEGVEGEVQTWWWRAAPASAELDSGGVAGTSQWRESHHQLPQGGAWWAAADAGSVSAAVAEAQSAPASRGNTAGSRHGQATTAGRGRGRAVPTRRFSSSGSDNSSSSSSEGGGHGGAAAGGASRNPRAQPTQGSVPPRPTHLRRPPPSAAPASDSGDSAEAEPKPVSPRRHAARSSPQHGSRAPGASRPNGPAQRASPTSRPAQGAAAAQRARDVEAGASSSNESSSSSLPPRQPVARRQLSRPALTSWRRLRSLVRSQAARSRALWHEARSLEPALQSWLGLPVWRRPPPWLAAALLTSVWALVFHFLAALGRVADIGACIRDPTACAQDELLQYLNLAQPLLKRDELDTVRPPAGPVPIA